MSIFFIVLILLYSKVNTQSCECALLLEQCALEQAPCVASYTCNSILCICVAVLSPSGTECTGLDCTGKCNGVNTTCPCTIPSITIKFPTTPTSQPSNNPTLNPTNEPTVEPTSNPTNEPTFEPTSNPTDETSTSEPTEETTAEPTFEPAVETRLPLKEHRNLGGCTYSSFYWGKHDSKINGLLPIDMNYCQYHDTFLVNTNDVKSMLNLDRLIGGSYNGLNKLVSQLLTLKLNNKNGAVLPVHLLVTVEQINIILCRNGYNPGKWHTLASLEKTHINGTLYYIQLFNNGHSSDVISCTDDQKE